MITYYVDHRNGRDYYPPRNGLTPETAFRSEWRAMLEIELQAKKKPPASPVELTFVLGEESK